MKDAMVYMGGGGTVKYLQTITESAFCDDSALHFLSDTC